MKEYVRKNPEILMLLYIPIYLLWFVLAEHFITEDYYVSYMKIDDQIPYIPEFVLAYIAWYPFILFPIPYLYIKDRGGFIRYGLYLIAGLTVSLTICCLFPNGQNLRPDDPGDGICALIVKMLYAADTNTNVLPSMHVVTTLGTCMAVFDSRKLRKFCLPVFVIAGLICASTVFIKQHSILDCIWGAVVALVLGIVIYCTPYFKFRNKSGAV